MSPTGGDREEPHESGRKPGLAGDRWYRDQLRDRQARQAGERICGRNRWGDDGSRHGDRRQRARRRLPAADGGRRGAHVRRGQDPRQLLPPRGSFGREGHAHGPHDRPPAAPAVPQGLAARDPAGLDPDVDRRHQHLRHPRDERRQRRAAGVGHPLPEARRRGAHRPGRRGQLPRQPRRGVAAREPARPDRRRHRRRDPDGRGRLERDHRGRDPRCARHRARRDQAPLRGPGRAAQEGRQGQDRDHAAAGRRVRARRDQGPLRRRPRRRHAGRRQARASGRDQGRRGRRAEHPLG